MILKYLERFFDYFSFRPLQSEIITQILQGKSCLAVLPTGSGKSLLYQLPSLILKEKHHKTSLVISPLISLIQDQIQQLPNKKVGQFHGQLSSIEKQQQLELLKQNKIALFYVSPESLQTQELLSILKGQDLGLIAIDEAHCVSAWGHSFRPSYLKVSSIVNTLNYHALIAVTATSTRKCTDSILNSFSIPTSNIFQNSHYNPNLSYNLWSGAESLKIEELINSLHDNTPAIVYALKQEDCESISYQLGQAGFKARSYHAGMPSEAKKIVLEQFMENSVEVVVATIAFGMGVNKSNIRSVIHYHPPRSIENWIQESGRAGRDGNPAQTKILISADDWTKIINLQEASELDSKKIAKLINQLTPRPGNIEISPYDIQLQYDISLNELKKYLTHLENTNMIAPLDPTWKHVSISTSFYNSIEKSSLSEQQQTILRKLCARKKRTSIKEILSDFQISLVDLMNMIEDAQFEELIKASFFGRVWRLKVLKTRAKDLTDLVKDLQQQSALEKEKILQVQQCFNNKSCLQKQFSNYLNTPFDQKCNNCFHCLQSHLTPIELPSYSLDSTVEKVNTLIHYLNSHKCHFQAEQIARCLIGSFSPQIRKLKLLQHDLYGSLHNYPYSYLLKIIKQIL